jgi:hypothetical protein
VRIARAILVSPFKRRHAPFCRADSNVLDGQSLLAKSTKRAIIDLFDAPLPALCQLSPTRALANYAARRSSGSNELHASLKLMSNPLTQIAAFSDTVAVDLSTVEDAA